VLCLAATAVYPVAALVNFKTRTLRVLVTVAGALLFTRPALFGILFGPIIFAFLHVPPQ
jgi:hypothetical protein